MQNTIASYPSHAKDLKKVTMTNEVSSAPSQIKHTGLSFQQTKALWVPKFPQQKLWKAEYFVLLKEVLNA